MSAKKDVVNWKDQMAADAKEVAKSERPSMGRISLRSGIMTYQDNPIPNNTLSCVVVASVHENVYYDKPFDPDVISPPACFALSIDGKGIAPHDVVPEPINDVCDGCDFMEWGSKGRGKACSERRRLALLPIDAKASSPDDIRDAEMAVLSLPVMSVANWSKYVNELTLKYERPPWGVLTEVSVKPDPKSQFKVYFKDLTTVGDDEALAAIHNRIEPASAVLMQPYDMSDGEEDEEDNKKKKY